MKAKAYASGTVLNALALGIGSAFGLELLTRVNVKFEEDLRENIVVVNGKRVESKVTDRVMGIFRKKGYIEVKTEIPIGSGLGSSSAFLNALICAILKEIGEELDAYRILSANARISLEMGISYTGAFDDASASLLGGFIVSDNRKLKLIRWDKRKYHALVLIPDFGRGRVSFREIRRDAKRLQNVLQMLYRGDYFEVMKENTKYYCEKIGYPIEIAEVLWRRKINCGLSGNGPCFVALGDKDQIKIAKDIWESYGKVLVTKIAEKPAENVIVEDFLFI